VQHSTPADLGVGRFPTTNGKGGVTVSGSHGNRSNYPAINKSSGSEVSSSVVASAVDGVDEKAEGMNRLGGGVRGNGPSLNKTGHSGVQASRAYRPGGYVEPLPSNFYC